MEGSAPHFDSEGLYYSYGNKSSYCMIDNSSMGQYKHRSYDDPLTNMISDNNTELIEESVSKELEARIDGAAKIIPSIRKLIYSILNVANEKQIETGDINSKQVPGYEDGLWQSSVSVNVRTSIMHT